jgi:RNA methyltransferase, TrmH family
LITSKDNEKLKLVRKLQERKHREREGLFVTEGEDLLHAGQAAGFKPAFVLSRAESGIHGEEVESTLLDAVSALGSGTRVIAAWALPESKRPGTSATAPSAGRLRVAEAGKRPGTSAMTPTPGRSGEEQALCVYLHGVGDPGNVGNIVRSAGALADAWVALGPGCADPYGPKAVRASMGAIFAVLISQAVLEDTPAPRVSMVAHGGDHEPRADARTVCLGSERDGLPPEIVDASDSTWTIPMREGAVESLGVAAAAAIALGRIGSPTGGQA